MSHSQPLLILVSGQPAAGKTTLARRIADEFHLPFFYKDAFKELLFDTLGMQDYAWSQQLGRASIAMLWAVIERELEAGCSMVAESNFRPEFDTARLERLAQQYSFQAIEIYCTADTDVLMERYEQRKQSGQRHPGHDTFHSGQVFKDALEKGLWRPVMTAGTVITVDTTDFASMPVEDVFAAIRQMSEGR
jgi:predicted kinase